MTEQVKRRGRPRKHDTDVTVDLAKKDVAARKGRVTVETWYELVGDKLSLCKKKNTGSVYRRFIGTTNPKKHKRQDYVGPDKLKKIQSEHRFFSYRV